MTTDAARQVPDIRSYFRKNQIQENQAAVTAVLTTAAQLQQPFEQSEGGKELSKSKSKTDRNNCGVRGGKSEVNWDPGL